MSARQVIYEVAPGIFMELDDETRRLLNIPKFIERPYVRHSRKTKKDEPKPPKEYKPRSWREKQAAAAAAAKSNPL